MLSVRERGVLTTLAGIRVLDFGRFVSGPYAATMLAEYGADVIRIERPGGGEDRGLAPVTPMGEGALFMHTGRNKRSLTLDLGSTEGRELAHRLVETADVVIVNMLAPALATAGLDYPTLAALREDLVYANVTAFGRSGSWSDRPGFDSVGQAMSGAVHLTGPPDQPYRAQVNWVDYATATHVAFAIMLALYERNRSGRGQEIAASLLATAVSFESPALIDQQLLQSNRAGLGNMGYASGPTDLYRARDGWLVCQVIGNAMFRRWAKVIGEPDLIDDPRFVTDDLRGEHGSVLSALMNGWCGPLTRSEAIDLLANAGVPAGPVLSLQEVLDHSQVDALDLLVPVKVPGAPVPPRIALVPLEMSVSAGAIRRPPPVLGQHTEEVLVELGLTGDTIAGLSCRGIV